MMTTQRWHSRVIITLYLMIYCYLINTVECTTHHNQQQKLSLDSFPNPLEESGINLCGRERKSFICDPNQFLHYKIADEIDEILANATDSKLVWCPHKVKKEEGVNDKIIENEDEKIRDNYDGLQIGIAIISSFTRYRHSRLRRDDDITKKSKIYAKSIHDQWGVGMAGCNNAVLIFVSIYDRYLYVSTGSGIKKIIKDDFVDQFIIPKYVKPLMKQQKYGEALKFIVESMIDVLKNSDNLETHSLYQSYIDYVTPTQFLGISMETWFMIILILCGIGYLGYKFHSERDYRACERELARLYAQKQANKFAGNSCPICLEEFDVASSAANNGNNNTGNNTGNERETAILICGHKFCKDCLDSWFGSQSSNNQKCPVCRHDRDDWSAATGRDEQKQQQNGDRDDGDDDEKKMNDDDRKHDDDDDTDYKASGYHKTSTSDDAFYDNNIGGTRQQQQQQQTESTSNGGFGFRRRNRFGYGYGGYGGMNMNDWMFQQELMFRMRRIRYMYPRYVNDDMVNRWSRPDYHGSYNRDQSFVRSNPNYRPPTTSRSGSNWSRGRSSGFSFGGGSSSGGGGGGGGW